MIIIPKGKPIHKELSSSFVNFDKLIEELNNTGFSGVIHMVGVKHEVEILMEFGSMLNIRLSADDTLVGKNHLPKVYDVLKAENFLISTYQMPPESVLFVSLALRSERVYERLSTEFTSTKKLVHKLEQEKGDFFIEAIFHKNLGAGLLFIQDGQLVDAILAQPGKDLISGDHAMKEVMDGSQELGADLNVYKANDITIEPVEAPPPPKITAAQVRPMIEMLLVQFETFLNRDPRKGADMDLLVRDGCLELADTYPFLDPFAAEFSYRAGQLTIESGDSADTLVMGIVGLLALVTKKLATRKVQFPLDDYRRAVLDRLQSEHAEYARMFELPRHLESLE